MSTRRMSFTKSLLAGFIVLLSAFGFIGCTDQNQVAVDEAKAALALVFATGDSATSVTQNLTLPTSVGDITIAWASNNAAVITNAGVVTRPEANTDVKLTATLTLEDATASREFTVTVIAAPVVIDVAAALAAIEITGTALTYNETTHRYTTTADIVLPTTALTLAVTWSTSNAAAVSAAGVVVRPAYGQTDSTAILTATIDEESRDFIITVSAITVKPASLILSEAKASLLISGGISGEIVNGDINLATEVGSEGVTVTWASSLPNVVSTEGFVSRPVFGSDNANVTLTATLHLGTETDTKAFNLIVTAKTVAVTMTGTIASTLAAGKDKYVRVTGVTVVGIMADAVYILDSTGLARVNIGVAPHKNVKVGNVYDMEAFTGIYYSAYEFTKSDAEPVSLFPSTAAATPLTYSTTQTISTINAFAKPSDSTPFSPIAVHITGKVMISGTGNYNTFLVPEDYTGTTVDKKKALMIYYKSNKAAISELVGQTITIDCFVYTYRTNDAVWAFEFTGTSADIAIKPMTDTETVAAAKALISSYINPVYLANATLNLPVTIMNTNVVWTSSDAALVNITTGALTIPATGQQNVTLTATITKGAVTDTLTRIVKVGIPPVTTIAEAIAQGDGAIVKIRGIVTALDGTAVFIQDATSGIYLYFGTIATWVDLMVPGNELELIGEVDLYSGWWEMKNFVDIDLVLDSDVPAADVLANVAAATVLAKQNRLVSISGLVLKTKPTTPASSSTSASYILTDGTNDVILRLNKYNANVATISAYLEGIAVGTLVNIVAMPVAVFNDPQLYITSQSQLVRTTDEEIANYDKNLLTVPTEALSGGALTLPLLGTNGSVISWAVAPTDATINGTTGVITFPVVTVSTPYTLTATITKGSTILTKEFAVSVRLLNDAEKLAEAKAALTLALTANELDVVTLSASGLHGTTVTWAVTSGAASINSGKITYSLAGAQTVVVTATINLATAGDPLVDTKAFNVVVSPIAIRTELSTLNEKSGATPAWTVADGELLYVRGIITGINGTSGVWIQDASGDGMYCYQLDVTGLAVGDDIVVYGTLGTNSSVRNIASSTLKHKGTSGNTVVKQTMTIAELEAMGDNYWDFQGRYVSITGLTIAYFSGDYVYLNWGTVNTVPQYLSFNYKTNYAWWSTIYEPNQVLGEVSFIFYNMFVKTYAPYYNAYNILNVVAPAPSLDEQFEAGFNSIPSALVQDFVIPTPLFGAWSADPTFDAAIGTNVSLSVDKLSLLVTRPALNAADVTGMITFTLKIGETTRSLAISVTVIAPDVLITEYIEGSSFNKAIEITNISDHSVDLSQFALEASFNGGSSTASLTLTGTLAAGASYVISRTDANSAIVAAADLFDSGFSNWNGDDAIVLKKNGTIIDSFGQLGVDPGSYWGTSTYTTSDHTLVRKPTIKTGRLNATGTFDPSAEWDTYAKDSSTNLGSHTIS